MTRIMREIFALVFVQDVLCPKGGKLVPAFGNQNGVKKRFFKGGKPYDQKPGFRVFVARAVSLKRTVSFPGLEK